jgi:FAD-dependent oxidoreductase domain-containing protein 1
MTSVLIVGGAAMGWATAHHLLSLDPQLDVTVIERDPTLKRSSTILSDGNVRIQFNREENIAMSIYAMDCLESFAEDMAIDGFSPDPRPRKQGNLFLVNRRGEAEARAGLAVQQRLGCDSHWLDMETIATRWPALFSDRLVGASFGPSDGTVDTSAVVDGYRRKSLRAGAKMIAATVEELTLAADRVSGVRLADGTTMGADAVVVCAGAWSTGLLATAGVDIPVEPVMRTVYVVAGDVEGSESMPLAFLPSGVYVIREHERRYLIAWSTDDDPVGFDFTPASRSKFYDIIWPELATNLPAFGRLEVVGSWAGLYAQNRLDANAIIGEWPGIDGLFQATGFSGHGFQQCHAVGRHLAELICARPTSLDLRRLGPERILTGKPFLEHAGRII